MPRHAFLPAITQADRARMVALYATGMVVRDVATACNTSRDSVYDALKAAGAYRPRVVTPGMARVPPTPSREPPRATCRADDGPQALPAGHWRSMTALEQAMRMDL